MDTSSKNISSSVSKVSSRTHIIVRGARENNLKNIDVDIPKQSFVVFTGVSGSGKSTLAFSTIYEEGRRRYIDSLSSYARQFLGNAKKPNVDSIEGLTPAVSIEQKTTHNSPRSTVGTITEIYDYLRLLYARIGKGVCPLHNTPVVADKLFDIIEQIFTKPKKTLLYVLAPFLKLKSTEIMAKINQLKQQGYLRVKINQKIYSLDSKIKLSRGSHVLSVLIDRVEVLEEEKSRIFDAIELAFQESGGKCELFFPDLAIEERFSQLPQCAHCDFSLPPLETNLFSFNSPMGMCGECKGLGFHLRAHLDLLISDPNLAIENGALRYFSNTLNTANLEWQEFDKLLEFYQISKTASFKELSPEAVKIILYGSLEPISFSLTSASGRTQKKTAFIEGLAQRVEGKYINSKSEEIRKWARSFLTELVCEECKGARLNEKALSVQVDQRNIYQLTCFSLRKLREFLSQISLGKFEAEVAKLLLQELIHRLDFLINVGLDYLTLNRKSDSLSGGESQRIRLATQIGSKLTGVLYVLDEPSIGLHPRDNQKLIAVLKQMVDIGNTLIVVEHDNETVMASDFVVDIGPKAGVGGGRVVFAGSAQELKNATNSLTADYIFGNKVISVNTKPRTHRHFLSVRGASFNNLKNLDVSFPLNHLVAVTGVSGSGKSTLVNEIIVKGIQFLKGERGVVPGDFSQISGHGYIQRIAQVTQSPIGRTPRSNPATYTGIFNDIRQLFAQTETARQRGYTLSRFSFNVPGGRCDKCEGDGVIRIEMVFLPDVYVKCDHCNGARYNLETLQVFYRGKNIAQVLEMSVIEALQHFEAQPKIVNKLQTLQDVGLDYITLGQSATTLSGGEAQRVKLALHLHKKNQQNILYVLDEPTTGLHNHDVAKLIQVLTRLVDAGNTVLVIEHNIDLIKNADYILDLGPEGGDRGGKLIVAGTPAVVAKHSSSFTGKFLKPFFA